MQNIIKTYKDSSSDMVGMSVSRFPDGELNVTLGDNINLKYPVSIMTRITSSDDLFILMQLSDILNRLAADIKIITVTYLMGARCDRVFSIDRPFTLKIMADVINSFNAKRVLLMEPHSGRSLDLIKNSEEYPVTVSLLNTNYKDLWQGDRNVLIAPDRGAMLRYSDSNAFSYYFEKKRDLPTGKILSLELHDNSGKHVKSITERSHIFILDDLSDGGGTFLMCADYLKKNYKFDKITLIVTHCIQEEGLKKLNKVFDEILITDSYKDWQEVIDQNPEDYSNVKVTSILGNCIILG